MPKVPESAQELTDRNWRAWAHYLECKATGQFPDDAVVRHNAGAIRRIEDAHTAWSQREPLERFLASLTLVAAKH